MNQILLGLEFHCQVKEGQEQSLHEGFTNREQAWGPSPLNKGPGTSQSRGAGRQDPQLAGQEGVKEGVITCQDLSKSSLKPNSWVQE